MIPVVGYVAPAPVIDHVSVAPVSQVNRDTRGLVTPPFSTACVEVLLQEIPEVQVIERTQKQIALAGQAHQEQVVAEETTLHSSSTTTSSATLRQLSSPAHTMAADTTGVKLNTVLVDLRCCSSLDEVAALVYNRVRQKLFDAEETTQNTVEIPSSSSTTSSHRRLDEFANMLRCSLL